MKSLYLIFILITTIFVFSSCNDTTGSSLCSSVKCSNHGKCDDSTGRAVCNCDVGYHQDGDLSCLPNDTGCEPICESWEKCVAEACVLRDGYCNKDEDCNNGTCDTNHNCTGNVTNPCKNVDCGNGGTCKHEGYGYGATTCECPTGFHDEALKCVKDEIIDKCEGVNCNTWEQCNSDNGKCELKSGFCNSDDDCTILATPICNLEANAHKCVADPCNGITCGENGACTSVGTVASCNCNDGYTPDGTNGCNSSINTLADWCGINWYGGPTGSDTANPINILKDYTGDNAKVYAQIYEENVTNVNHEQPYIKAQLGYTSGDINYPVNYNQLTWVDAAFNVAGKGDYSNNHEYLVDFPSDKVGTFKFIFRFSIDNGNTWRYCDAIPSPDIINSSDISYGTATIIDKNQKAKELKYNKDLNINGKSYSFSVTYTGNADIDFTKSKFYLNGEPIDLSSNYDATTKTFTISADNLTNGKYTYLFRVTDTNGLNNQAVYIPIWIEDQPFKWKDAFIYQIMTDRFNNADHTNDAPVAGVDTDKNWQGGDFAGIIEKIESGYFENMGVNVLWISSPILNTNGKGIGVSDGKWYSAYHSYWPIATGWTDTNHLDGISSPIDPHFGTEEELKQLIRVAHAHGIRVLADFVANHVFAVTDNSTATGSVSPLATIASYFHNLNNPYVCGWDQPITCWFTNYLPDFNYSNPILMNLVMNHAMWIIQEFDFDGYRLDAVKHMIMDFTTTIRQRIKEEIQTTGYDFYTIGETFDGNADFLNSFVGDDKLFGQFEFGFYFTARDTILHNGNLNDLKAFTEWNDTFYTDKWSGALMSNFLGNHDVMRALNEANGNYKLLQLAQTVLMTSPRIPLIYQGDEFGMPGGTDPDNRRFMRFDLTDNNEIETRTHLQKLGLFRAKHSAVRRGTRSTCAVDNNYWVYKMVDGNDVVIVGINKGDSSIDATCAGVTASFKDAFTGNSITFNGNLTVPANSSFVIGIE